MDPAASNYLLALGTISITFVSVSAVAVVFRQVQGAVLSKFELLLMRAFLVSGLMATVASLLPPLLALFGITPSWVWRVSSLAFALAMLWRQIFLTRRRRQIQPGPQPSSIYILQGITIAVVLGLFTNAIGILSELSAGLYALAATWLLVNSVATFIISLSRFLESPKSS
jgi:hypothetical protein